MQKTQEQKSLFLIYAKHKSDPNDAKKMSVSVESHDEDNLTAPQQWVSTDRHNLVWKIVKLLQAECSFKECISPAACQFWTEVMLLYEGKQLLSFLSNFKQLHAQFQALLWDLGVAHGVC